MAVGPLGLLMERSVGPRDARCDKVRAGLFITCLSLHFQLVQLLLCLHRTDFCSPWRSLLFCFYPPRFVHWRGMCNADRYTCVIRCKRRYRVQLFEQPSQRRHRDVTGGYGTQPRSGWRHRRHNLCSWLRAYRGGQRMHCLGLRAYRRLCVV